MIEVRAVWSYGKDYRVQEVRGTELADVLARALGTDAARAPMASVIEQVSQAMDRCTGKDHVTVEVKALVVRWSWWTIRVTDKNA